MDGCEKKCEAVGESERKENERPRVDEKWEAVGESERKENKRPWVDVKRSGRPLVNLNDKRMRSRGWM